ncbi:MAG: 4Fe-4S dicluster domain-containing protein [Candidatus Firestonebacteria bacterium]
MKRGTIWIDIGKCVGCKTCELQCAVVHSKSKNLFKAISEEPISIPRIKVESVGQGFSVPLQCRHCEDAPCVKICPTRALEKSDIESPVLINKERCIGCRFCVQVCPFGVIRMDKLGTTIVKCDLCIERLKNNELPACVSSCPTHVLKFKSLEEQVSEMRKKSAKYMVEFVKDN